LLELVIALKYLLLLPFDALPLLLEVNLTVDIEYLIFEGTSVVVGLLPVQAAEASEAGGLGQLVC